MFHSKPWYVISLVELNITFYILYFTVRRAEILIKAQLYQKFIISRIIPA